MERIWNTKQIKDRYGLKSLQSARNYIRRIDGHLENPLGVYESDLQRWENGRRVGTPVKMKVPRTREG